MKRFYILDVIKLLCCFLILLHHWANYIYPTSNHSIFIAFLLSCRSLTGIFFSLSGFLFYQKWLTVIGKNQMHLTDELKKSFLQVAPAYYFAICLALLAIGIINLYSQEPIDLPTSKQILLNLLMMQDMMQYSSISAGLWYIIIHLQNIFFSLLLLRLCIHFNEKNTKKVMVSIFFLLWLSSIFYFNLQKNLDFLFLYFFSSYGLGLLAGYVLQKKCLILWLGIGFLTILTLSLHDIPRLGLSYLSLSGILMYFSYNKKEPFQLPLFMQNWATQVLYLFLFHYPLMMVLNPLMCSLLGNGVLSAYSVLFLTTALVLFVSHCFDQLEKKF